MAVFESRPVRRRSILLKRDESVKKVTLVRSLVIANLVVVSITAAFLWLSDRSSSASDLGVSMLATLAFTNPITILAHFSSEYVQRRSETSPKIVRMLWLALAWMVSGGVGSAIGYVLLSLFGIHLQLSKQTWSIALLSNGLIAIVIGTFVLLFEATGERLRKHSRLLGQEDLLTAELSAARTIQQRMLPSEDVRIHGFDISSATAPAVEIGGDYYDYLSFADGSKGILVADAAGKGIPAALVMAKFQGMAQALSIHVNSPSEFFVGLNDTLRVRLNRSNFITVGMLTIDFDDRLTFYRAGHNPLLIYCASTQQTQFARPPGMALGLAHGATVSDALEPHAFEMQRGDVVVLYSDGLNEAVNPLGDEYGDERIAAAVRNASSNGASALEIREAILLDIAAFVATAEPHDDMTLVVVRRR